jgi:hypothetical protein
VWSGPVPGVSSDDQVTSLSLYTRCSMPSSVQFVMRSTHSTTIRDQAKTTCQASASHASLSEPARPLVLRSHDPVDFGQAAAAPA